MLRQELGQNRTTRGRVINFCHRRAMLVHADIAETDLGVQGHHLGCQRMFQFADFSEGHALARLVIGHDRQIIETQNNILRGHDDRLTISRMQDVVGGHHQHAGFKLGFKRQRHVNGHLVAVEVGIEGCAYQRMQLNGLAFDQHRFKGLNTKTMQGRRTVKHHRMLADDLVEDIPNFRLFFFNQLLRLLHSGRKTLGIKTRIDEGLEQFERHLLGQPALMQLQFRAHHDHRAAGIVNALAQKVLAEATLLAFQHIGERLQRTLVSAGDDTATTTIVKQCIHRFLQHALFVADDDVRRAQFDQTLQAVVTVDHTTIEIVQIRCRKATAIKWHQWAQIRRDHGDDRQDHPFRLVAGLHEGFDDFQPLGELFRLQLRGRNSDLMTQISRRFFQIKLDQDFTDSLCPDHGGETVFAIFVLRCQIIVFRQQLEFFERCQARLNDAVIFEIKDLFQILQRHIEQQANAGRQRLQEPDMGNGSGQFDMAHPVAPYARQCDFDAALFADDAFILHPLVLAAQAFVILDRAKDTGTEQAITFGLECPVVDGFRLLDLAIGPREDLLRARDRDLDMIEALGLNNRIEEIHDLLVHVRLLALAE